MFFLQGVFNWQANSVDLSIKSNKDDIFYVSQEDSLESKTGYIKMEQFVKI